MYPKTIQDIKELYKNQKDIIIIGGGKSIQEGIDLGLKDKLKNKFVIACNYAYKHFHHTFLVCVDYDFYVPEYMKKEHNNPDIYKELKKEPLILTTANISQKVILPNTIKLQGTGKYNKDPLKNGFYNPILCGLLALHIAEYLEPINIYLLGHDWNRRIKEPLKERNYDGHTDLITHYYSKKEIPHKGHGYVGFFENHLANQYFKVFDDSNCKIYNVSLNSNIENFPKITYQQFFANLQS